MRLQLGAARAISAAMTNPPLKAVIIPVTPLQQNCCLIWCTRTMRGAFTDPGGDRDPAVARAKIDQEIVRADLPQCQHPLDHRHRRLDIRHVQILGGAPRRREAEEKQSEEEAHP